MTVPRMKVNGTNKETKMEEACKQSQMVQSMRDIGNKTSVIIAVEKSMQMVISTLASGRITKSMEQAVLYTLMVEDMMASGTKAKLTVKA